MRDVLEELIGWWQAGETVGMGTVVATWRSAPRPAGASMLVGPDGTARWAASPAAASRARSTRRPRTSSRPASPTLERYGVSDDDAFAVGLTCGGILDVFVESVSRESFPELGEVAESVESHEPVAVVTVVKGPTTGWAGGWSSGPTASRARSAAAPGRRRRRRRPRDARRRAAPGCCTSATTASAAATT